MIEDLVNFRKNILYHYSPYSFLPSQDKLQLVDQTLLPEWFNNDVQAIEVCEQGFKHVFFVKHLSWDSEYFSMPTYKILGVVYAHSNYFVLRKAVKSFVVLFVNKPKQFCITEIPSEDIWVVQAFNEAGFRLVETRLTYYLDLKNFVHERYSVRSAKVEDIENLKRVAREMKNEYDRFHADYVYSSIKADEFLATYIEESIKGFADYVMVPSENGVPADAFVSAKYLKSEWHKINNNISIMVLSAVSADTCRGWYLKLISEMAYHLQMIGAEYAFMHPASTNRAVIHTYEKLGCKYGKCINILTYQND